MTDVLAGGSLGILFALAAFVSTSRIADKRYTSDYDHHDEHVCGEFCENGNHDDHCRHDHDHRHHDDHCHDHDQRRHDDGDDQNMILQRFCEKER